MREEGGKGGGRKRGRSCSHVKWVGYGVRRVGRASIAHLVRGRRVWTSPAGWQWTSSVGRGCDQEEGGVKGGREKGRYRGREG